MAMGAIPPVADITSGVKVAQTGVAQTGYQVPSGNETKRTARDRNATDHEYH